MARIAFSIQNESYAADSSLSGQARSGPAMWYGLLAAVTVAPHGVR